MKARSRADGQADWERLKAQDDDLHADSNSALTRLRLLAAPKVVAAAEQLHVDDHRLTDLAYAGFTTPSPQEDATFSRARATNRAAKEAFFDAARAGLGLGQAKKTDSQLWST